VEETEEECRGEAAPAASATGPKDVLHGNEDDAGGDERLDDSLGEMNDVEGSERESDGVGEREGADDFDQVPEGCGGEDEGADEEQMVVAGENVMNALVEKCLEEGGVAGLGGASCLDWAWRRGMGIGKGRRIACNPIDKRTGRNSDPGR
jgi:hypothetical protein